MFMFQGKTGLLFWRDNHLVVLFPAGASYCVGIIIRSSISSWSAAAFSLSSIYNTQRHHLVE